MYGAICGKCGNKCEVPFRPTEGKPVFCSQCFDKGNNADAGGKGTEQFKEQFEMLNIKLDKILMAITPEKKEVKKSKDTAAKTKTVLKKRETKKKT